MNRLNRYPWTGPEWIPILALTLIAALARFADFGRLGIDHFDEGIYALVSTWPLGRDGLAGISPELIAYAPPGYPLLVGMAYLLFGPSDVGAVAISILAGTATIPIVAWLARRTFGPSAGVAAAGFVVVSGLHVTFSRMALTDATFLLTWLVAIGLGGRFLERPGPLRAILFGLSVGAAQLCKYNGWLVGPIVGLTALLGPFVSKAERDRKRLLRTFGWGALAAVVAFAVYWPWFRFVDTHGGYSALLKHQRSYLGSLASWPSHLWTQLCQIEALTAHSEGRLRSICVTFSIWGMFVLVLLARKPRCRTIQFFVCLLLAIPLFGQPSCLWWLGIALFGFCLKDLSPSIRLVGVWWLTLSLLTPLYHPYVRLWLPLEAAGWLLGGFVIAVVFGWDHWPDGWPDRAYFREHRVLMIAVLTSLVISLFVPNVFRRSGDQLPMAVGPRDSFRSATAKIVAQITPEARVVRVLARPALGFYASGPLAARGVSSIRVGSLADLETPGQGWAIVDEVLLRQEGGVDPGLARLEKRWEIVARVPNTLSNATLLDVDPGAALGDLSAREESLFLLRPRQAEERR
jgi:dolichyl-phosphate-mannose-protein mannosyltransferase